MFIIKRILTIILIFLQVSVLIFWFVWGLEAIYNILFWHHSYLSEKTVEILLVITPVTIVYFATTVSGIYVLNTICKYYRKTQHITNNIFLLLLAIEVQFSFLITFIYTKLIYTSPLLFKMTKLISTLSKS